MELNTTEIISVGISVMVIILAITAIVISFNEPNYVTSHMVLWPF